MWFGIVVSALAVYACLALLSWNPVSFVILVTALSYAAGALGAKFLLREHPSGMRWAGVLLVCGGVALVWAGEGNNTLEVGVLPTGMRWAVLALAITPFVYYLLCIHSALSVFFAHRNAGR